MDIETLLKGHRIEIADGTWLCWDGSIGEWVLRERPYRAKITKVKATYSDLASALTNIASLLEETEKC